MTELVEEGIRNNVESLQAEGMDCEVESIVSGTTGTSATIVPAPKQRTTPLRSWIWKWGVKEGKYWRCAMCIAPPKLLVFSATTHIIRHLNKQHHKYDDSMQRLLNQPTLHAPHSLNRTVVIRLLLNWIVQTQQPFTVIESEPFRHLIVYFHANVLNYLPKSCDTLRNHAASIFRQAKGVLIASLSTTRSKIHFSFDLWSSPNYKAMLAVVGHWTAIDHSLKTVLLGITEIHGSHTGSNISENLFILFDELKITSILGYSVSDNAGNNDTALDSLSDILFEKSSIFYDAASHRLRCLGHIINLVVKTLLFGSNMSSAENIGVANGDTERSFYVSAIGKLHHVVHHIRMTPQRRDIFYSEQAASLQASPDFMVIADNATRWNSTYHMIKSALLLCQRIDGYIRLVGTELTRYTLSDNEWDDLSELAIMLASFDKVSTITQGNNQGQGSIVSVLLSMDMLLSRLESIKANATASSAFYSTVDAAWSKLNKYYMLTDRSAIYVVAIILHPCLKMKYFQRHWAEHPDWIESARRQLDQFYTEYSGTITTELISINVQSEMDDWCFGGSIETGTELDEYLTAPVITLRGNENIDSFNIVDYWKANDKSYPTLARISYDVYAVPAMSAEPECVFSRYGALICILLIITAKQTITDRRNRLGTNSVEIIECLNSWMRQGIISELPHSINEDIA